MNKDNLSSKRVFKINHFKIGCIMLSVTSLALGFITHLRLVCYADHNSKAIETNAQKLTELNKAINAHGYEHDNKLSIVDTKLNIVDNKVNNVDTSVNRLDRHLKVKLENIIQQFEKHSKNVDDKIHVLSNYIDTLDTSLELDHLRDDTQELKDSLWQLRGELGELAEYVGTSDEVLYSNLEDVFNDLAEYMGGLVFNVDKLTQEEKDNHRRLKTYIAANLKDIQVNCKKK